MRFDEIKIVTEAPARIQHAEDEIFFNGSKGALRVVDALASMANDEGRGATTIKWDGSPAVIFGRNEDGDFVFTDKSGFSAKGYDGKTKSADDVEKMFLNRPGAQKNPEGFAQLAANMKNAYTVAEKAVPLSHKGYFKGDMLYFDTPPVKDGRYVFKPQLVTYTVDAKSDIGKRIGASKVGVVIHREVDEDGSETPLKDYSMFEGNNLLVFPPITPQESPQIDTTRIDKLKNLVTQNAGAIDSLLDRNKLTAMKVSDFDKILYTYMNSKVDSGLTNLGKDFIQWLSSSKVSKPKQEKITQYVKENIKAFSVMWETVSSIMSVKDDIINQLEQQDTDIKASIGDTPGGEGYVLAHPGGDIKLVNRSGFSKANRAVKRENTMKATDFIIDSDMDDDFADMKKQMDPADSDDAGLDPDFKQTPMIVQVGKVLDSRGNPNPVKAVTTDDGKQHEINAEQATVIKMLLTTDRVKPDIKRQFTKDVQNADTLGMLLGAGGQKEMVAAFLKKYQPQSVEKSNYA